jgi:hypothetical protein
VGSEGPGRGGPGDPCRDGGDQLLERGQTSGWEQRPGELAGLAEIAEVRRCQAGDQPLRRVHEPVLLDRGELGPRGLDRRTVWLFASGHYHRRRVLGSELTLTSQPGIDIDGPGRLLRYVRTSSGDVGEGMVRYDHTGIYDPERNDASPAYLQRLYANDLRYAANPTVQGEHNVGTCTAGPPRRSTP